MANVFQLPANVEAERTVLGSMMLSKEAAAASFRDASVSVVEGKLLDTLDTYLNEAKSDLKGDKE